MGLRMYETLHKYKLLGPLLKKTKKPFCKKIKNRMALGTSIDPVRFRQTVPVRFRCSLE